MAITFGDFLSIFTTNDASGGRAIKATFDTGIDDAQNYLTKNDPAGGRAIKIVNVGAPLGPQFWTEAYSATTQTTSSWTAIGAATDINAAIIPKGTGAIVASIPDGTAVGGNARGTYAVDLQMIRLNANQVASGDQSFLGGGYANRVSNVQSVVVGGNQNSASNDRAVIVGGISNQNSGSRSVLVGGEQNNISGTYTFIGGGIFNTSAGSQSTIAGGQSNNASGNYAFIGGGQSNTASGSHSSIGGGQLNTAAGLGSFVGGGIYNRANGLRSVIVGGGFSSTSSNRTESSYSFIGSGYSNTISSSGANDYGALIVAGTGNTIGGGTAAVIVGGQSNSISKPEVNSGNWCFIGGGQNNRINGPYSNHGALVGGYNNTIGNGYSITLVGGANNTINGSGSFIGGGNQNTIGSYPSDAALTGGRSNTISANGNYGHIGGGQSNTASATHTTVSGGQSNSSSGSYSSVLGGLSANSNLYGQVAHASGQFSAQGDAQAHELIWRREITGTAQTELFLDGSSIAAILPGTNTVWNGIIDITSICTVTGDGTTVVGDVAATAYKVTIKRIGTTTSLVGGVQEIGITNADASMSTAVFTIDNNDTNESLRVQFTPPSTAGSTTVIRAVATFRGTQIKY